MLSFTAAASPTIHFTSAWPDPKLTTALAFSALFLSTFLLIPKHSTIFTSPPHSQPTPPALPELPAAFPPSPLSLRCSPSPPHCTAPFSTLPLFSPLSLLHQPPLTSFSLCSLLPTPKHRPSSASPGSPPLTSSPSRPPPLRSPSSPRAPFSLFSLQCNLLHRHRLEPQSTPGTLPLRLSSRRPAPPCLPRLRISSPDPSSRLGSAPLRSFSTEHPHLPRSGPVSPLHRWCLLPSRAHLATASAPYASMSSSGTRPLSLLPHKLLITVAA